MKSLKHDTILFLGLFLASIFVNYYLPAAIRYVWFWGLIGVFLKTKSRNNYFWIIFFWFLLSAPGYLFYARGIYSLPAIPFPGFDRDVHFSELFCMVLIFKAFLLPAGQKVFYQKPLQLLIAYSVFLLLLGLLSGMGIYTFLKSIRYFIPILLLPIMPRLIPRRSVPNALFLIFLSVFLLFGAQLIDIIIGKPVAVFLGETQIFFSGKDVGSYYEIFDVTRQTVRTIYGPFILLSSIVLAMMLLVQKKNIFPPGFLYVVIFIAALSIFFSATRGWISAAALICSGFGLFYKKKTVTYVSLGAALLAVILVVPQLNLQFTRVVDRVYTLGNLVEGDLSAGGTLARLTERSPRVMNKFREKPIFGFGFSDEYYEYADGHVGNQTLLLNGGIVGYALYLCFLLFLMSKYLRAYIKHNDKAMIICLLGLLGLFVIHSSSRIIFSYYMDVETALSLSLFFFFSDYFLKYRYQDENNSH